MGSLDSCVFWQATIHEKKNWKWVLKSWRDFLISLPFVTHPALIAIRFCQSRVIKALSFNYVKEHQASVRRQLLVVRNGCQLGKSPRERWYVNVVEFGSLGDLFPGNFVHQCVSVCSRGSFFDLVQSYQFAFRQQRGRREDDHSKRRIEYCFAKYDYENRMVRRLDYSRRRAIK